MELHEHRIDVAAPGLDRQLKISKSGIAHGCEARRKHLRPRLFAKRVQRGGRSLEQFRVAAAELELFELCDHQLCGVDEIRPVVVLLSFHLVLSPLQ